MLCALKERTLVEARLNKELIEANDKNFQLSAKVCVHLRVVCLLTVMALLLSLSVFPDIAAHVVPGCKSQNIPNVPFIFIYKGCFLTKLVH